MSTAKSDTSCQVLNALSVGLGARQEVAMVKSSTIADDRLDGVKAIADFVGEPPRRVYYLL